MVSILCRGGSRLFGFICAALVIFACLGNNTSVTAQSEAGSELTPFDLTAFPRVEAFMHVYDSSGAFISGLAASNFTIIEDGQRLPPDEFEELQPGAIFVVAINPGRFFALRDGAGVSRFDLIRDALTSWASNPDAPTNDDVSLIINDGPVGMHLSARSDWLTTLKAFSGEMRSSEASVDILSQAINAASIAEPRPGMGRSVLLITAPPPGDLTQGLPNLVGIANQAGVQVSVWLVDAIEMTNSPASRALQQLATETGGSFFYFSGTETFPDPETYLTTSRGVYQLAYRSQIATSGSHTISIEVALPDGLTLQSVEQTVTLDLRPPAPAFVAPPARITRHNPADARNVTTDLEPTAHTLVIAIDFPDGTTREIVSTSLFVDGVLAAVNTSTPFDQFQWDISPYLETGQHILRVEVMDSQGLVGSSGELPVSVEIQRTQPSMWKTMLQNVPWFAGGAVLLSGAVLVLVLVVSGKIKPKPVLRGEKTVPISLRSRRVNPRTDPVTQAVEARQMPPLRQKQSLLARLARPHRRTVIESVAFLTRLAEGEIDAPLPPVAISRGTTTVGADPVRADLVLEDPSIEPLHARIQRDGSILRISDAGSVAGTWVNYSPVSGEGTILEHGDIIHVGRVGFRVALKERIAPPKPVITPEEHPS